MRAHSSVSLRLLALLAALAIATASTITAVSALTVDVAAGEVLDLTEPIAADTSLSFQFGVADEEYLSVQLLSGSDNRNLVDFGKVAKRGDHLITGSKSPRVAIIRLDNTASTFATVTVDISLHHMVDHNAAADASLLDPIERKVNQLTFAMRRLEQVQAQLRIQQRNHRATVEDANERVLLWSIFQVVALIAMSGFQLYFLKRFLEKKSFV